MLKILDYNNYYFIGIGGIGMSALARYFKLAEKNVLGYDKTPTKLTNELSSEGISIIFDDDDSLIDKNLNPENTLVIFTPAVPNDSKVKNYFINKGFTLLKRSQVLGELTKSTYCVAIGGTHGKTTTTTLTGHLCKYANLPATAFLGGISENYNSNFIFNGDKISIVEADEFDRSFLRLSPNMAVITSTDADHLDIYGEKNEIIKSFNDFANLVPHDGFLFVREGSDIERSHLGYSATKKTDFYAENIKIKNGLYIFDLVTPEKTIKNLALHSPGIHNIENAIAAISIGLKLGIDEDTLRNGLLDFKGVKRRFTKNVFRDKIYIDDYAHHPTELNAVIGTIKNLYPDKKLLTVFQPHLFSRTRDFADEFAESLNKTDELLLLEIYPARELPIQGITSTWLAGKTNLKNVDVCELKDALDFIKKKKFDIILTVGAGNIDILYELIINLLDEKKVSNI